MSCTQTHSIVERSILLSARLAVAGSLVILLSALACSTEERVTQISTEAELRVQAARDRFNHAIARRDPDAIEPLLMPEYHVVSSLNVQRHGATEAISNWRSVFSQGSSETYVRRSREIRVNEIWGQAEELGDWEGTRLQQGESVRVRGTYAAKWVRDQEEEWRLLSETFTLMGCEGPARGCQPS